MTKASRKHGGKRSGAGRPKGSQNTLEYGEVAALAATKLRVPEEADDSVKFIAGRALIRMLEAMEGKLPEAQARTVLAAATRIREEACGPLAQKVEHSGRLSLEGLTDEQLQARFKALTSGAGDGTREQNPSEESPAPSPVSRHPEGEEPELG